MRSHRGPDLLASLLLGLGLGGLGASVYVIGHFHEVMTPLFGDMTAPGYVTLAIQMAVSVAMTVLGRVLIAGEPGPDGGST